MLKRLRSAIQAARAEYRLYPERMKRKENEILTETVDEVLHQLASLADDTTMSFVKRFLLIPSAEEMATFIGAIGKLPVAHQLPLMMFIGRRAPANWVTWPGVLKWTAKNGKTVAAIYKPGMFNK